MKIILALLEKDYWELDTKFGVLLNIKDELGINNIQIDFCDGIFVENKTFIPEEDIEIKKMKAYNTYFDVEYHIMCKDQLKYLYLVKEIEAKKIIIHIDDIFDSDQMDLILNEGKYGDIKIFITAKLDFLLKNKERIVSFLKINRYLGLQIMSIDKIGIQGQNFDDRCIELLDFLKHHFLDDELDIQLDGAINDKTLRKIRNYNVNSVVIGSYLVKDIYNNAFYKKYRELI